MSGCCLQRANGVPPGSGGGAAAVAATWTERFLGALAAAPIVDLAAGTNPTVTVTNATASSGQVASMPLTSNAGDATASVTQGTVGSFGTDGATGLRMIGASASTLMVETAQNAPHVFWTWADALGENPRGGVDYCLMVRFASQDIGTAGQAAGTAIYSPNDGSPETGLTGNPAIDDEKCCRAWAENISGTFTIVGREESTPFQGIQGALIPAGWDTVGMIVRGGGSIIETIVGVSAAGVLPDPDTMTKVPGPFLGGSTTYPSHPYLTPAERCAIPFQQQLGSTYNATIDTVRVLSRLGRSSP